MKLPFLIAATVLSIVPLAPGLFAAPTTFTQKDVDALSPELKELWKDYQTWRKMPKGWKPSPILDELVTPSSLRGVDPALWEETDAGESQGLYSKERILCYKTPFIISLSSYETQGGNQYTIRFNVRSLPGDEVMPEPPPPPSLVNPATRKPYFLMPQELVSRLSEEQRAYYKTFHKVISENVNARILFSDWCDANRMRKGEYNMMKMIGYPVIVFPMAFAPERPERQEIFNEYIDYLCKGMASPGMSTDEIAIRRELGFLFNNQLEALKKKELFRLQGSGSYCADVTQYYTKLREDEFMGVCATAGSDGFLSYRYKEEYPVNGGNVYFSTVDSWTGKPGILVYENASWSRGIRECQIPEIPRFFSLFMKRFKVILEEKGVSPGERWNKPGLTGEQALLAYWYLQTVDYSRQFYVAMSKIDPSKVYKKAGDTHKWIFAAQLRPPLSLSDMKSAAGLSKIAMQEQLISALDSSDVSLVKELIPRGVDVNEAFSGDRIPLECAAKSGCLENVNLLLKAGANPVSVSNALFKAASGEIVDTLVKAGGNVNTLNSQGRTPLFYVEKEDVAERLLAHGAKTKIWDTGWDYNKSDVGYTPLHRLVTNSELGSGHHWTKEELISKFEVVVLKPFLKAGADINIRSRNRGKETPLHYAAVHSPSSCKVLLKYGADPNLKDSFGQYFWEGGTPSSQQELKALADHYKKGASAPEKEASR